MKGTSVPDDELAQTAGPVAVIDQPQSAAPRPERHGRLPFVRFVLWRIGAGLVTLLVVSFLIFMATNALPGNVADTVLGRDATPERIQALEQRLNLDQPLLVRYGDWLTDAAQGDLGDSAVRVAEGADDAPITAEIGTPLRNSLVLASIAGAILLPFALGIGLLAGVREGKRTDYIVSYAALTIGSVPEFVIGAVLIVVFFTQLGMFPPVSLVPPGASPLDDPSNLVLPIATLLAVSLAFCARQVRAGVAEVMHQEYVTSAQLNGIGERRILSRYVLRNSLAPAVQSYTQTLQFLLGGIVVVEVLFAYPGIGNRLQNAVQTRDITEVQAIALIMAAIYVTLNILADLIVVLLIPKLRTGLK